MIEMFGIHRFIRSQIPDIILVEHFQHFQSILGNGYIFSQYFCQSPVKILTGYETAFIVFKAHDLVHNLLIAL